MFPNWAAAMATVARAPASRSGDVPVPGALPELGPNGSAGLRPSNRHFTGTRPALNDLRTISR